MTPSYIKFKLYKVHVHTLKKFMKIDRNIPTKVWYNALLGILRGTSNYAHCLPRSYDSTIQSVNDKKDITTFERHLTMLGNVITEVSSTQTSINISVFNYQN